MKYLFVIATILFISCSKKETPLPAEISIVEFNVNKTTLGKGGLLVAEVKLSDTTIEKEVTWSLSIKDDAPIEITKGKRSMFAQMKAYGDYVLTSTIVDKFNREKRESRNIKVLPADIGFGFWGDSKAAIGIDELYNSSTVYQVTGDGISYKWAPSDDFGLVKTGEIVSYNFDGDKLVSGAIIFKLDDSPLSAYNKKKQDLSRPDFGFDGISTAKDTVIWEKNQYADQYKDLGLVEEGMIRGYADLVTIWESGRSKYMLLMTSQYGNVSFVLYIEKK